MERFGADAGWQLGAAEANGHFDVLLDGQIQGRVCWELMGEHNRLNALAAIAAARHVGVAVSSAIDALSRFQNVKRRMEVRGVAAGVTVYDDFAHHPTAIATTLAGLRHKVGGERILAVLEPRSNTMKLGTMKAALPAAGRCRPGVLLRRQSGLESRRGLAELGARRLSTISTRCCKLWPPRPGPETMCW